MAAVTQLTPVQGLAAACRALDLPRCAPARDSARTRRRLFVGPMPRKSPRGTPPLALSAQEREALRDVLNSERFVDTAPAAVHATLLDEGRYLGSVRTMYRKRPTTASCRTDD